MYLVSLETLVLEELRRQQPLQTRRILERIRLRTKVTLGWDNLYVAVRKMEKDGLVLRHKRGTSVFVHLTIKGLRQADANCETVWKIFPLPPESDPK